MPSYSPLTTYNPLATPLGGVRPTTQTAPRAPTYSGPNYQPIFNYSQGPSLSIRGYQQPQSNNFGNIVRGVVGGIYNTPGATNVRGVVTPNMAQFGWQTPAQGAGVPRGAGYQPAYGPNGGAARNIEGGEPGPAGAPSGSWKGNGAGQHWWYPEGEDITGGHSWNVISGKGAASPWDFLGPTPPAGGGMSVQTQGQSGNAPTYGMAPSGPATGGGGGGGYGIYQSFDSYLNQGRADEFFRMHPGMYNDPQVQAMMAARGVQARPPATSEAMTVPGMMGNGLPGMMGRSFMSPASFFGSYPALPMPVAAQPEAKPPLTDEYGDETTPYVPPVGNVASAGGYRKV